MTDKTDWLAEIRRYGNAQKRIRNSESRWYFIYFKDGSRKLAYLRVLQGGLFSGLRPAIYRGRVIPHRIDYATFHGIKDIKIAF